MEDYLFPARGLQAGRTSATGSFLRGLVGGQKGKSHNFRISHDNYPIREGEFYAT